ncbi:MAG TPA: tetratricopeptide repeat protein [Terriglobales bacterium]|nr:tetratricopeptide repeat protein [Terriglobales bacterium]
MRKLVLAIVMLGCVGSVLAPTPARAEDKGIIALQQSVALLMNQLADLQKSFNTQVSMIQGMVSQNTDTVNKLSSALDGIQRALNGNQVIATQQQSDISKQFQALADTIAEVQSHLQKMDDTLNQVHQLQQTIPAPAPGGGGMPGAVAPGGDPTQSGMAVNPGAAGAMAPGPAPSPAAASSSVQLYQTALTDYANSSPAAQTEFARFVRDYPNDPQVPDATYYLGMVFLQKQEYNEAIDRFSQVIEQYPDNPKASAAELSKGIAYSKSGNRSAAISEFRAVAKNYPGTDAARQADIELKSLGASRGR